MISTDLSLSILILDCVDLFLNISKSIAGATNTGALHDKNVVSRKLFPFPDTKSDMVLAVAGAMTIKSAQEPKST